MVKFSRRLFGCSVTTWSQYERLNTEAYGHWTNPRSTTLTLWQGDKGSIKCALETLRVSRARIEGDCHSVLGSWSICAFEKTAAGGYDHWSKHLESCKMLHDASMLRQGPAGRGSRSRVGIEQKSNRSLGASALW